MLRISNLPCQIYGRAIVFTLDQSPSFPKTDMKRGHRPLFKVRFTATGYNPGKAASALPRGLGHEMGNQLLHLFSLTARATDLPLFVVPQTQHGAKFLLAFLTAKIIGRHAHPPFDTIPFSPSESYQPPQLVIKFEKRITSPMVPEKGLLHIVEGPNVKLEILRKFPVKA